MKDDRAAAWTTTTAPLRRLTGIETDGFASYNAETGTARVLLYHFRNDPDFKRSADVTLQMHTPQFAGKQVQLTLYRVDDDCNYFDEWQQDRKTYGIGSDKFSWSPDDPCLDSAATLHDPDARVLYFDTLRSKYIDCARLTPQTETADVDADGNWTLHERLEANTVLFFEIA